MVWCGLSFFLQRSLSVPVDNGTASVSALSRSGFSLFSLSLSWASSLRGKSFPLFLVWRLCYFDTHTTNNSILRPHVQGKKRPRVTYLIFFFVFRRFSYFSFFKWILLVFWTLLTKSGSPAAKGVDGRIIFHLTPPKCIFIFFFLSFFLSFKDFSRF